MNNCILLPIEAESQDTALRIFSTLNDRGKPLSDADIFKAQFYKYYSAKGEREVFIQKWKDLEVLCDSIFHPLPAPRWMSFSPGICITSVQSRESNPRQQRHCANSTNGMHIAY
ncbi:MAG: hypothetical protein ACLUGI_12390 [Subdoligranulum sp.]